MERTLHTDLSGDRGDGPNTVIVRNVSDLGIWSESQQAELRDCLTEPTTEELAKSIRPHFKNTKLHKLKTIWKGLTEQEEMYCKGKCGEICKVLGIDEDFQLIKALIFFWDPQYRCFTFGDNDLILTVEEYSGMLWPTENSPKTIYVPEFNANPERSLASLLKIQVPDIEKALGLKNGISLLTVDVLIKFMNQCSTPKQMEAKMNAFLLATFSNVVFPVEAGKIGSNIIVFCDQMIKCNLNPAPAILAETIAALNYCRRKGRGRIRCCTQMLYVWAIAHLKVIGKRFIHHWFYGRDPLYEVTQIPLPERKMWPWVHHFQTLTEEDLLFEVQWVPPKAGLYQCGDQPWVPLMGFDNLVSYAPSLGLRQFNCTQFVSCTKGLNQVECCYSDPEAVEMLKQARMDWKALTYVVHDETKIQKSDRYQEWHTERYKAIHIPDPCPEQIQELRAEVATQGSGKPELNQKIRDYTSEFEQDCNQLVADRLAEVQKKKREDARNCEKVTKLEADLAKITKRKNDMADKYRKCKKQNEAKGERLERMAAERARQAEMFKVKEAQWRRVIKEKQESHQRIEGECNFYKQQVEELEKMEEEYEAMVAEREAELGEMIRKKEISEGFAYLYQEENYQLQQDFQQIRQHRDECLRIIDEQNTQFYVARGDRKQFCQTVMNELQPALDSVKRAHGKVTGVLDNMVPGLHNSELLRKDLEEAREDLAPYLHDQVAPRMLGDKAKGKQKIQECD